jgi:hypothetical protein
LTHLVKQPQARFACGHGLRRAERGVNGLGLSVTAPERHAKKLSRMFATVPDSLQTFEKWLELVVQHSVVGAKMHDGRRKVRWPLSFAFNWPKQPRNDSTDCDAAPSPLPGIATGQVCFRERLLFEPQSRRQ